MMPPADSRLAELALADRAGLPEPLRVLVAQYPRLEWEGHSNFTALTRFWLDMHLGFRRMQGMLLTETRGFLDRDREPREYARGLVGLAGEFLDGLHGHHNIEDFHYFPILKSLDARIGWGFDLLDADHQAMDGGLEALARSMRAVLRSVQDGTPADVAAGTLLTELTRFERLLDRHLTDEEELVVPVILDHPEAGLG